MINILIIKHKNCELYNDQMIDIHVKIKYKNISIKTLNNIKQYNLFITIIII